MKRPVESTPGEECARWSGCEPMLEEDVDRMCLAPGDLGRGCGGGRKDIMLVVMAGMESGEVARRGVSGR
jgi:hypothetical protein